ncbi:MAG: hypothetical protein WC289_01075 [Patescibacteria group bacterium]|jgi:hypothetical protein
MPNLIPGILYWIIFISAGAILWIPFFVVFLYLSEHLKTDRAYQTLAPMVLGCYFSATMEAPLFFIHESLGDIRYLHMLSLLLVAVGILSLVAGILKSLHARLTFTATAI